MVFGSGPLNLFGWENQDGDMMFAQDTSRAVQFVRQWKLRMRAQEATLKEITNSKLRRQLAHNKSFNCPDMASVLQSTESEELSPLERTCQDSGY